MSAFEYLTLAALFEINAEVRRDQDVPGLISRIAGLLFAIAGVAAIFKDAFQ